MTGAAPVSAQAFAALLAPLLRGEGALAIGVSGGGDSMALMALTAEYARPRGVDVLVLTVDHGLRPESAAEARRVAEAAARLGLSHETLRWEGAKPEGNLQAAAREARYALMRNWRGSRGVATLAVAHNADDLAETFLLRLARGSGVDGLAAMPAERPDCGLEEGAGSELRLIRPLLDLSREALRATCRAHGLDWIEDPSNQDLRFDRVQARKALEALAPLGLTRERLGKTAKTMRRARSALEAETCALLRRAATIDRRLGWARIEAETLAAATREIGLRALARLLQWTSGAPYPPRLESLEAAFDALTAVKAGSGRTLHGCAIAPMSDAEGGVRRWSIAREPAATAPTIALDQGRPLVWDNRFPVALRTPVELRVGRLGEAGAAMMGRRIERLGRDASAAWRRAPLSARRAAPALWSAATTDGDEGMVTPDGWRLAWTPVFAGGVETAEVGLRPPLVIEQ